MFNPEFVVENSPAKLIEFPQAHPPTPGDFKSFKSFEQAWNNWGEKTENNPDYYFISAWSIWEQTYLEVLDEWWKDLWVREIDESDFVYKASVFLNLNREDGELIARSYYRGLIFNGLANPKTNTVEIVRENYPRKVWIEPEEIELGYTQTRIRENREAIDRCVEKMEAGIWEWEREPLPELIATPDGKLYPISGNHRIKAALKLNRKRQETLPEEGEPEPPELICCWLKKGTLEDAQLEAIRSPSNNDHGEPETAKDFRNRFNQFVDRFKTWDDATLIAQLKTVKADGKILSHAAIPEAIQRIENGSRSEDFWKGLSGRIIATYLGVGHKARTVGNLMAEYRKPTPESETEPESNSIPSPSTSSGSTASPLPSTRFSGEREEEQAIATPQANFISEQKPANTDDYVLGFISNIDFMNASHIAKVIEEISRWLCQNDMQDAAIDLGAIIITVQNQLN